MVKKTIEIYIAEDGREFQNEQECKDYEENCKLSKEFDETLKAVEEYCRCHECDERCMFYYCDGGTNCLLNEPYNWDY